MREKKAVPQKVFPAQAGVILLPLEMENDLKGFPRASGGDPTFLLPLLLPLQVFPAQAGVILLCGAKIRC